jgi:hypothetical protein
VRVGDVVAAGGEEEEEHAGSYSGIDGRAAALPCTHARPRRIAPSDCVWVTTGDSSYSDYEWSQQVCDTDGATVTLYVERVTDNTTTMTTTTTTTLTVERDVGEDWTLLSLSKAEDSWSSSGLTYGGSTDWSAAWTGDIEGFPTDGSFTASDASTYTMDETDLSFTGDQGACAWGWRKYQDGSFLSGYESVYAGGIGAGVTWDFSCGYVMARFHGVDVGSVDLGTWESNEVDGDGYTPDDDWDCDDTDPAIHPCADDIANDGIDQDCDGADLVDDDLDDDGYAGVVFGGDDCDDADPAVHPGADDPADGADQDCDGADDVDADGDGYTADGDDKAADCDDTASSVHAGASEIPYDGVDQNCDGADVTDQDGDGYHAVAVGRDDCDDHDSTVHPGASDTAGDGVDADCDGHDGVDSGAAPETGDSGGEPDDETDDGGCGGSGGGGGGGCGGGGGGGAGLFLLLAAIRSRRNPPVRGASNRRCTSRS